MRIHFLLLFFHHTMAFLFQQDADQLPEDLPPIGEKHQDLLVFGYHCKLFRDDDRARAIDSGEHLIPWMGDGNLKIDRSVEPSGYPDSTMTICNNTYDNLINIFVLCIA